MSCSKPDSAREARTMSLGWTLLGTLGQLALANFMFMLAVFAGGGLASGTSRS